MRLESVSMPSAYRMRYDLPTLGVEGTRARTGVRDTSLIGTIIKPNVGMSAAETAGLVDTLCRAGVDFIKDDEVCADPDRKSGVEGKGGSVSVELGGRRM